MQRAAAEVSDRPAAPQVQESSTALTVRDLVAHYGSREVLHGVSFDLHAGEILGIGGLLGSGRTEILEAVFGATQGRVDGEISVGGKSVSVRSPIEGRR